MASRERQNSKGTKHWHETTHLRHYPKHILFTDKMHIDQQQSERENWIEDAASVLEVQVAAGDAIHLTTCIRLGIQRLQTQQSKGIVKPYLIS